MLYRFYRNGKLQDKEIVAALKEAVGQYENGEIIEVRDLLFDILEAIATFEEDEGRR